MENAVNFPKNILWWYNIGIKTLVIKPNDAIVLTTNVVTNTSTISCI